MGALRLTTVALLLLASGALGEDKPRQKVAVLDFQVQAARPEFATAAVGIVANELQKLNTFEVVTADAIRSVLANDRQKQLLGCSDSGCLVELAEAMGAQYLVTGTVSRVEGSGNPTFTLELALVRATDAKREASELLTGTTEAELLALVGPGAVRLTAKLLVGSLGTLLLSCSETGAAVKIDGSQVGTTPTGQLQVTAGPHVLVVEKEGFVRFQRELRVQAGDVSDQKVTLVPSPDFIAAYESRASRTRASAWIFSGLAVVGFLGAGAFQLDADHQYGNADTDGTFLFYKARLATSGARERALGLKATIDRDQILSYVSGAVGVAAAVTAAILWITGDDPGKYRAFHVALLPGPSAGASVGFSF